MKEPKFLKPVAEMLDVRIVNGINRILNFFHAYAREGYCPGDLFTGWDWPTMNAVFPELVAKYNELKAEALRRLEATGGILNKVKYVKTERGWKEAA